MPVILWLGLALVAGEPKPANFDAPTYPSPSDYLRILERFPRYAERGWHDLPGQPGLGWFGDGHSGEQGQRTLANFILVYAWLATNDQYDPAVSGVARETLRDHCLAAIRWRLRTHVTGDLKCTDGKPWGNHWQSAWWVSRMLGGTDLVAGLLTKDDHAAIARVVQHEASRHIGLKPRFNEYGDTKSEENAWDSEVLAWALNLYPDHPRAAEWKAAFNQLCLNTLSVEADLKNETKIDGKPIKEWVGGPCIHPDFTIENHGPFHICYQVCPQHSFAWDYYAFRRHGRPVPPVVYHHLRETWNKLKQFHLWQGRFAYVGGKDWPRYAYGLYFILPALVHMQQAFGDADARLFERLRVATFEREQLIWNDGSFFSGRFTKGIMTGWPSEWETDCAANLAIADLLHRLGPTPHPTSIEAFAAKQVGTVASSYCEMIHRRDPFRFASWCWRSHAGPVTGTICSDRGEHMLEWDHSLSGAVSFADRTRPGASVVGHVEEELPGGYTTTGVVAHGKAAQGASPWRLEVVDDNVPCRERVVPDHPLFSRPNRIESLAGLTDLDSITTAGPGWTVLARNARGGPSILEFTHGKGRFLLSMTNLDQLCVEDHALGRQLMANVLAYLGAKGRPCAYLAGETWLRQALEKVGQSVTALNRRQLAAPDALAKYAVLFVDRSAEAAIPLYPAILRFVERGGIVFHCVLQDKGWTPDAINTAPATALQQTLSWAVLPDGRTAVHTSRWQAQNDATLRTLDLLDWRIANDVFNDRRRTVASADPQQPKLLLEGLGLAAPRTTVLRSRWLTIDDDLAVVVATPGASFSVDDTPVRRPASLCVANIRLLPDQAPGKVAAGQMVAQSVCVFRTRCNTTETAALARALSPATLSADRLSLQVPGVDGKTYTVTVDLRGEEGPRTSVTAG
jgi:hypothetical protein